MRGPLVGLPSGDARAALFGVFERDVQPRAERLAAMLATIMNRAGQKSDFRDANWQIIWSCTGLTVDGLGLVSINLLLH